MGKERARTVIVADRHPALLRALKQVLEPEFEIIGMVDNAVSLMDALEATEPDAVVTGFELDRPDGHKFVRHLARRYPHVPIVIVGDVEHAEARELGAVASVSKKSAATGLIRVVSAALESRSGA